MERRALRLAKQSFVTKSISQVSFSSPAFRKHRCEPEELNAQSIETQRCLAIGGETEAADSFLRGMYHRDDTTAALVFH